MATSTAWLYVINAASLQILRKSHNGITIAATQPGNYIVTLPFRVQGLAAVGSIANSIGVITVIPGESAGLARNQVKVLTLTLANQLSGGYDFSLAIFYQPRWSLWPIPWRRSL